MRLARELAGKDPEMWGGFKEMWPITKWGNKCGYPVHKLLARRKNPTLLPNHHALWGYSDASKKFPGVNFMGLQKLRQNTNLLHR